MSETDIDKLLYDRALTISKDPDATTAQLEWVRKFLNDHSQRNAFNIFSEQQASQSIKELYGDIQFDRPIPANEVDLG